MTQISYKNVTYIIVFEIDNNECCLQGKFLLLAEFSIMISVQDCADKSESDSYLWYFIKSIHHLEAVPSFSGFGN